jgi:hypothetical protein
MDEYKNLVLALRIRAVNLKEKFSTNAMLLKELMDAANAIEYLMRKLESREAALTNMVGCLGNSTTATTDVLDTTEDRIT